MTYLSSAGVRCIAYDRRGHGRSDDSGRGYDFDTLANDLAAVIEHLALREITLIGRAFTETDFRPELRTITVPTLLIHGDIDTSAPLELTGRRTASLIPGSRLEVYEGAAHGLPITHMERLNRDLLSYVTS